MDKLHTGIPVDKDEPCCFNVVSMNHVASMLTQCCVPTIKV